MKKRLGIITILALITIIIIIIGLYKESSPQNLPFLKDFTITNIEEKQIYGSSATETSATKSDQIIKILHLKPDLKTARLFLDEKNFGIESLYNALPSPYPDVITREIVCPEEFLPIVEEDDNKNFYKIIYTLFANNRFSYGICSQDNIAYKSIFSLIHCKKSNNLYQIKFFSPLESYNEETLQEIRNFHC
jgi:hypothetical protein|tara:strand:- start:2949 stop:3521 length:573 start_codon:yes stop_codon:yes gene_type:complete